MNKEEEMFGCGENGRGKSDKAGGEAPPCRPDGWEKQLLPVQTKHRDTTGSRRGQL